MRKGKSLHFFHSSKNTLTKLPQGPKFSNLNFNENRSNKIFVALRYFFCIFYTNSYYFILRHLIRFCFLLREKIIQGVNFI